MGSAQKGSLRISCFLTEGPFGFHRLTCLYLPKSARAYFFPQSVKIHCFCSGPMSVDPICPQPRTAHEPRAGIMYTDPCTIAAGAVLVRRPWTFRGLRGFLTNKAKNSFFEIIIVKGFLTNKGPPQQKQKLLTQMPLAVFMAVEASTNI